MSSSKVIIDAVRRGVPSVGLDTADGVAPDREDIFARSHTDTFFGVCFTLILDRLSRFFAFQRSFDLRCFLATFFALLFGISCSSVVLDCLNDLACDVRDLALRKYKFAANGFKPLHAVIENNVWIVLHVCMHLLKLINLVLRWEVLESIPRPLSYFLWNLWSLLWIHQCQHEMPCVAE